MRILLWHGYLLGGTGSNVYCRALAREWSRGGHEVVVVSHDGQRPAESSIGVAESGLVLQNWRQMSEYPGDIAGVAAGATDFKRPGEHGDCDVESA